MLLPHDRLLVSAVNKQVLDHYSKLLQLMQTPFCMRSSESSLKGYPDKGRGRGNPSTFVSNSSGCEIRWKRTYRSSAKRNEIFRRDACALKTSTFNRLNTAHQLFLTKLILTRKVIRHRASVGHPLRYARQALTTLRDTGV